MLLCGDVAGLGGADVPGPGVRGDGGSLCCVILLFRGNSLCAVIGGGVRDCFSDQSKSDPGFRGAGRSVRLAGGVG